MKKIILINMIFLLSFQIVFGQRKAAKIKTKSLVISCGVCNQKAISLPRPDFPPAARFVKVSGSISVAILIDEKGNVEAAKAVSGHPLLRLAAEKAALQAKFEPFKLSEKAVKVRGTLVYNFINTSETEKSVKGGILNDKAIQMPKPEYPLKAKDLCVGGKVEVEVLVSKKGDVIEAKAISGDDLLRETSVEAAKKVKFSQNSHFLVKVRGILIYNFDPFVKCISAGIVNKKAKFIPKPEFPKSCRCQGTISVQVIIDLSGKVINARAIAGNPLLRISAVKSAKQALFPPTLINTDKPFHIRALLVYKFSPNGKIFY